MSERVDLAERFPAAWAAFTEWADENGVSLEDEGDWGMWWDCFAAGIDFAAKTAYPNGSTK